MKKFKKSKSKIPRRKFLPFLSGSFFLPFLSSAKPGIEINDQPESYQTMLTQDGKIVRVKSSAVNDSDKDNKRLSNRSMLKWINKNNKDI